jgi:AraC-like DNA-binding protein
MPRPDPVRFELDLRRRGFPSVPIFGRYHYSNARPGLAPHRHADAIEICHLVRGRQVYEVGGRRFGLRGGDLFLTFPGEDHGTGREPEEKGLLFWVVVLNPRRTHGSLLGLAPGESLALWKALIAIRRTGHRHFPAVPAVKRHLDLLAAVTHERQSPLLCVAIRNQFVALLLAVLDSHGHTSRSPQNKILEFLIQHIAAHLEEPEQLTLDKLAAITRLSLSRFQAKFKAATGIPPAEYVLRARIAEAARRLARPGASVTRVAFDLGFSSSQYFAVSFKRFTNRRPKDYLGRQP